MALLRGVNVGGRAKVPMAELRRLVESLGHADVRTYVQSGNVVFGARPGRAPELEAALQEAVGGRFGASIGVVVRTADELADVATRHPLREEVEDHAKLHVFFLADEPAPASGGRIDAERVAPDTFVVDGRHVYAHYPNGAGRSKLTLDRVERALGTRATARNLKTVAALVQLAGRG